MKKEIMMTAAMMLIAAGMYAQKNYEIGNPKDEENYGYLKDYAPLKNYVNYEKYPNFHIASGTTVNDYLSNSTVKGMINDNFTESAPGNAMKMASCVNNSGSMDFSTVKRYVAATKAAGVSIYGHTLAWHAQQASGWLNSLMKDKPAKPIEGADTPVYVDVASKDFRTQQSIGWHSDFTQYGFSVSYSGSDGLKVQCTKKCSQNYEVQYIAMDGIPLDKSKTYKMIMTVKGSKEGSITAKLGDWSTGPTKTLKFTTDWQDVEVSYNNTVANPFLLLQHGLFVGDIYIKSIRFQETVMGKQVNEERRCLVIDAQAKLSVNTESQLILKVGDFKSGDKYKFSALVRADKRATVSTQINGGKANPIGTVLFVPEWRTVTSEGTLNGDGTQIQINLAELDEANRYCFDDISMKINDEERIVNGDLEGTDVSSFNVRVNRSRPAAPKITESLEYFLMPTPTPLTPEEKRDTLIWAMDKWIKGMMNACEGQVKAWDVVNEAISGGGNDGSGNYTLQHNNGSDDFFWQDYMGDLEYVRNAVRLARKYGPEDIKLFINDYNLESDWDGNKKLKSLINWIKKWEADGVTYVDGIGTQMHISYYMNQSTQNSKKNAITNMFKLMAESGKLVRVSELDMGFVDANGNDVPTSKMTEDYHHRMADFYEWIIKQYLEIIPPAQQWGICFWCPTDAPSNSGWRANTPVGVWDINKYRKHVYAGIVRGLGGVDCTGIDDITPSQTYAAKGIIGINGMRMPAGTSFTSLPAGLYIIDGKKVLKR